MHPARLEPTAGKVGRIRYLCSRSSPKPKRKPRMRRTFPFYAGDSLYTVLFSLDLPGEYSAMAEPPRCKRKLDFSDEGSPTTANTTPVISASRFFSCPNWVFRPWVRAPKFYRQVPIELASISDRDFTSRSDACQGAAGEIGPATATEAPAPRSA